MDNTKPLNAAKVPVFTDPRSSRRISSGETGAVKASAVVFSAGEVKSAEDDEKELREYASKRGMVFAKGVKPERMRELIKSLLKESV